MLEITKAHEITTKDQVFGPQISHKTIHGIRILCSKNQA